MVNIGVKTLRNPKVQESYRKYVESSRNPYFLLENRTFYILSTYFLLLSILMCFRRVFTPRNKNSKRMVFWLKGAVRNQLKVNQLKVKQKQLHETETETI